MTTMLWNVPVLCGCGGGRGAEMSLALPSGAYSKTGNVTHFYILEELIVSS